MKKSAVFFAAVICILTGCSSPVETERLTDDQYLRLLLDMLPDEDKVSYTPEFWEMNVAATLRVRDAEDRIVPEDIFRHFILPVRTYNEPLDDFRIEYGDSLCAMVRGLSLEDAALKINHWCLSFANYGFHESSMDSPRGTMARGKGVCEELSVLVASALRAAGIPARVVKANWVHSDGIHSWVEAWTDEGWKFMGACEPDGNLNESWVNGCAPNCAQIQSFVCGSYDGPEPVVTRTGNSTVINVIDNYSPERTVTVTVLDASGKCVKNANVEFKIYNGGALKTLQEAKTDSKGRVSAVFGPADVAVWASKDGNYFLGMIDAENDTIRLERSLSKYARFDLDMRPGKFPSIPRKTTKEQRTACSRQIAVDDSLRNTRHTESASEVCIEHFKTAYASPSRRESSTEEAISDITYHLIGTPDSKKDKASVSSVHEGKTVPAKGKRVYKGPLLVVSGTRLADGTALVRAELLPTPEGGKELNIKVSFRTPDAKAE